MTTAAFIGKFKVGIGDDASPQSYTNLEEVLTCTGVGKLNELKEVTNFDSPAGTKEYIAGLAEGQEVVITCNYKSTHTEQQALIGYVDAGSTKNFRLLDTDASPNEAFQFDAVCLGWRMEPSTSDQNQIVFTVKITGDIQ